MIEAGDRLSLSVATALVLAALAAAREAGFHAAAAVVDAGGHLVAFGRDDEAAFLPGDVATRKAWTAAASGLATHRWCEFVTDDAVAPILHNTGLMAVPGGLPLHRDGRLVGALGVSGGAPDQDLAAATTALATLAKTTGVLSG